ncbi:MAG TPA: heat-inducible transcriptional repressor HrcA [Acidimicrobiales bacterium]|jgi:heat-inducible transcriptional repressor
MLDDRKAAILKAVIEKYIETAQPVGSAAVAKRSDIDVSSATVRHELGALESEGYLDQPHTSAGRIPTDKGYRFFVDELGEPAPPPATAKQVRAFFNAAHGELERMLLDTSKLLSNLTNLAGVVVGGSGDARAAADIRSIQLVGLGESTALMVAVMSNGAVVRHTLDSPHAGDTTRLGAATVHLGGALDGVRTTNLPDSISATGDAITDALVTSGLAALCDSLTSSAGVAVNADVHVGGTARLAEAFDAVETVRSVLATLEQQLVVVSLVREVLDRDSRIAIGGELGLETLSQCSVVVAPYEIEGEIAGTIGVLGPTRMDYSQALAAVTVVSKRLGGVLGEGGGA